MALDLEERWRFAQAYLTSAGKFSFSHPLLYEIITMILIYYKIKKIKKLIHLLNAGDQPNDKEVDQLVMDAEKYTLANHIFWGLWGVISVSICQKKWLYFFFLLLCSVII